MEIDKRIQESELILNPDGSIYHLNIKPENIAENIILVGDPGRVKMISDFFDVVEFTGQNREFIIHTGFYAGKKITAMSTGMGTDNIDVVLNELDALVNIDLETRSIKTNRKSLNLFRFGTSGSIQPDLPLNAVVVSEYGLGIDGMLFFYDFQEQAELVEMKQNFLAHTKWSPNLPTPYIFSASSKLIELFASEDVYKGITITAPGFYGPQGRKLRLPLAFPDLNEQVQSFRYGTHMILNFEMETSALYGLSRLLGHHAITVCLAIANRKNLSFNKDYHPAMEKLVVRLLKIISKLKY